MSCIAKRNLIQQTLGHLEAGVLLNIPVKKQSEIMLTRWGEDALLAAMHSSDPRQRWAALQAIFAYQDAPPQGVVDATLKHWLVQNRDGLDFQENLVRLISYWERAGVISFDDIPVEAEDVFSNVINNSRRGGAALAALRLSETCSGPAIVTALLSRVDDKDPALRNAALSALLMREPKTSRTLVDLIREGQITRDEPLANRLTFYYQEWDTSHVLEEAISDWMASLDDSADEQQLTAEVDRMARFLKGRGSNDPDLSMQFGLAFYKALLVRPSPFSKIVRRQMARLFASGWFYPLTLDEQRQLIDDDDPVVRSSIFAGLKTRLPQENLSFAPEWLHMAARDHNAATRVAALETMSSPPGRLAVCLQDFLLAADSDLEPHPAIRAYAVQILAHALGENLVADEYRETVISAIFSGLNDSSGRVQDAARTAFRSLPVDASGLVVKQLMTADPNNSAPYIEEARRLGTQVTIPLANAVRQSIQDGALSQSGENAAGALLRIGDPAVEPVASIFLKDPDPMVRAIGVDLIGAIGSDQSIAILESIPADDPVKLRAVAAIKRLTGVTDEEYPDPPPRSKRRKPRKIMLLGGR